MGKKGFFRQWWDNLSEEDQVAYYVNQQEAKRQGSLEDELEHASHVLVEAMRALRQSSDQQEAMALRQMVEAHARVVSNLSHYIWREAKRFQRNKNLDFSPFLPPGPLPE